MSGRDPVTVIQSVRFQVPPEHTELRSSLEALERDCFFQPPESKMPWLRLQELLEGAIGQPSEPWHFAIVNIVQGRAT